ncbi:uncharacterized protein K452DRAFT_310970 [Aplosporella prunicola CBS 121167]|uniref:Uncharacterized protein n=1 Tax=Aplosporella prunicola CBS 121167 TaxID=1176127 RepID=A0A6A6B4P7_9PEZI|nr:uncharacterized protein K452DRAFT_310970 [Aplosporella prunicola CBS 121167]KAF2139010.1 hypothetical protein K452DRAFT_310970 [Aplosporella prunicola CBS 121167]
MGLGRLFKDLTEIPSKLHVTPLSRNKNRNKNHEETNFAPSDIEPPLSPKITPLPGKRGHNPMTEQPVSHRATITGTNTRSYLPTTYMNLDRETTVHLKTKEICAVDFDYWFNQLNHFSKYHNTEGTGTSFVYPSGFSDSSVSFSNDILEEATTSFGNLLIKDSGAQGWIGHALSRHGPGTIERCLENAQLKYSDKLYYNARRLQMSLLYSSSIVDDMYYRFETMIGVMWLMRNFRYKIAQIFIANARTRSEEPKIKPCCFQELGRKLLLVMRSGPLDEQSAGITESVDHNGYADKSHLANPDVIKDYLVSEIRFKDMVADLRRRFFYDGQSQMQNIDRVVCRGLASDSSNCLSCSVSEGSPDPFESTKETDGARFKCHHRTSFSVDWDPLKFMDSQYGSIRTLLGKVVTLTGSAICAHATTCQDYIRTVWPSSGPILLAALEEALKMANNKSAPKTPYHATVRQDDVEVYVRLPLDSSPDGLHHRMVTACGSKARLVEIAQQFCWLGAALGASGPEEQIHYAESSIAYFERSSVFAIWFDTKPLRPDENCCWLPLFGNAVIAAGFPIPPRQGEIGLEVSVDTIAGILGIQHAVEYNGGVVMKGFSSLLVPVAKNDRTIQWHLITNESPDIRLSYQDGLRRCKDRLMRDVVGLDAIRTTRAIVGWINFTGATLGFQQFGVGQADFALGAKDGKCHFQRNGPYKNIISAAEKTPVVLYDTFERRAWLVPAANVILHLAQHRHWLEPYEFRGKRVKLFSATTSHGSAREILLQNAKNQLSDDEEYTFKDLVLNIWSLLEFLLDQNVQSDCTRGAPIRGTTRDVIQGFEFKAISEERSPFHRKHAYIQKSSSGWTNLVRDIDALVLFASGFEDIIRPTPEIRGLCHYWQSVPKSRDYLAASVKSLQDLYDVAGCRLSKEFLTYTHLQWHRGSSILFEPCKTPNSYRCSCNRLQQIVGPVSVGRVVPPGLLQDEGAVIFGRDGNLLSELALAQQPCETTLYSQPNISLGPGETFGIPEEPEEDQCTVSDSEPSSPVAEGSEATAPPRVSLVLENSPVGLERTFPDWEQSNSSQNWNSTFKDESTSVNSDINDRYGSELYEKGKCPVYRLPETVDDSTTEQEHTETKDMQSADKTEEHQPGILPEPPGLSQPTERLFPQTPSDCSDTSSGPEKVGSFGKMSGFRLSMTVKAIKTRSPEKMVVR